MTTRYMRFFVETQPDQHVATESLSEGEAFCSLAGGRNRNQRRALGQLAEDLVDQRQALLDFADADPDPRVDVAGGQHRHVEGKIMIGRVADRAAGIEAAPRGASDKAAGAELARIV